MKKKNNNTVNVSNLTSDEFIEMLGSRKSSGIKKIALSLLLVGIVVSTAFIFGTVENLPILGEKDSVSLSLASVPVATTTSKDSISVPVGVVKQNPFLPYKDLKVKVVSDVPNFDIIEPPETISESSDAARIMNTVVSGILFDTYSPSAILNIEGKDYLVKKGDVINNYKVMCILKDSVTVQLGTNTYKAGIGEILTEGVINPNEVANLDKKFGGKR